MQRRGGVKIKNLQYGWQRQQASSWTDRRNLSELVESIQDLLSSGHSVTIEGLGTFQTALTSQGCVLPERGNAGESCYFTRIFCGKLKIQQGTEEDKVYPHTF